MTSLSSPSPKAVYQARLEDGSLSADAGQNTVIDALDALYHTITQSPAKPPLLSRLFKTRILQAPQGIYLYGGVGRGKSLLMDMFYDCLPSGTAMRVHFHDFMVMAHDAMNEARANQEADPIVAGAKALMKAHERGQKTGAKVLCFDEMEVRDIADAMIVKRLFDALFAMDITVVATSNRHPDDLYKGGLHRDRFLPFIAQLKTCCTIIEIANGNDWRSRLLGTTPRWYAPSNKEAYDKMVAQFALVTCDSVPERLTIKVAGRDICFDKVAHNIAFATFDDLCAVPLAARDYVAIADRLTGLFITDIPQLDDALQNEARRLMWLIDALYDRGRFVVASAGVDMNHLYQGHAWAFEFDRTLSRLSEMTRLSPGD